tara:strand:+ start:194 stop:319 length:126 start_codon:yes stop_codon:yes gene_type:complete
MIEVTGNVPEEGFVWFFTMVGIWNLKFIFGSLIDKKAEPKE